MNNSNMSNRPEGGRMSHGPASEQAVHKPLLIGEPEAARMLGISPRKLFDLRKSGRVPFVHMGRRVLYRVAALEDFAASASTFNDAEGA